MIQLTEVFAISIRITTHNAITGNKVVTSSTKARIWAEGTVDVTCAFKRAVAMALNRPYEQLLECQQDADMANHVVLRYVTTAGDIVIVEEIDNDDEFIDLVAIPQV